MAWSQLAPQSALAAEPVPPLVVFAAPAEAPAPVLGARDTLVRQARLHSAAFLDLSPAAEAVPTAPPRRGTSAASEVKAPLRGSKRSAPSSGAPAALLPPTKVALPSTAATTRPPRRVGVVGAGPSAHFTMREK